MNDGGHTEIKINRLRLRGLRILALAVLLSERLGTHGLRIFCWFMLFGTLWLLRAPAALGHFAEITAFLVFTLGCLFLIWKDMRHFRWPGAGEILRRIEQDGGVKHRPLTAMGDRPVNALTPAAQGLWEAQRRRLAALIGGLALPRSRPFLARRDPYAIRLGLMLAFLSGLLIAGPQSGIHLREGLTPFCPAASAAREDGPLLWITPPAYTGQAQIVLSEAESPAELSIPEGSQLKILLDRTGILAFGRPALYIDDAPFPLSPAGDGAYTLEMEIPPGSLLSLHAGRLRAPSWRYSLIPDTPPAIKTAGNPELPGLGQIQFPLEMQDDYGVQDLRIEIELAMSAAVPSLGKPYSETRSVMSPPGKAFSTAPLYDLSAHPWAGLPVLATFTARDHKGQEAKTEPVPLILPERVFSHPVAKLLIEIRKQVARRPLGPYDESIVRLERILAAPGVFRHDRRVHLPLRAASSRMRYNRPSDLIALGVMDLLWRAALHLEDGGLSLAAQDLRAAQAALEEALKNPETAPEDIARLMEKLREAMGEYMQAMAREMQKRMAEGQMPPPLPREVLEAMMGPDDLAAMLDKMEADLMGGDRGAAQNMLSQLQRLLDMMNPAMNASMPEDMQAMMEGINRLGEIIERQETLLGKTKEQAEIFSMLDEMGVPDSPGGQKPFMHNSEHREEQDEIRGALNALAEEAGAKLEKIPDGFGPAEGAMAGSSAQLGDGQPDMAVPFQEEAIERLKDSRQQLSQAMAGRMKQMTGLALGGSAMQFDPLGRPSGGGQGPNGLSSGSDVKVPGEAEAKKIQDIVNEIRRRAGDRSRPPEELEYYRRLLKRF